MRPGSGGIWKKVTAVSHGIGYDVLYAGGDGGFRFRGMDDHDGCSDRFVTDGIYFKFRDGQNP